MGKTYVMVMETKTRKWISPLDAGVIDVYVACADDV